MAMHASIRFVFLSIILCLQHVDGLRMPISYSETATRNSWWGAGTFLQKSFSECNIAVLVAVSTRNSIITNVAQTDLMQYLMPSFVKTTDSADGCEYALYISYDNDDKFYQLSQNRKSVEDATKLQFQLNGKKMQAFRWVEVLPYEDGQHGPVRAWNEGFAQANEDGHDYFTYLGEDVVLLTSGWGKTLTDKLKQQDNYGNVGPNEVRFQNGAAKRNDHLPFSMVHKSHMQVFGYLFPAQLHNYYADNWLEEVYKICGLHQKVLQVNIDNKHMLKRYSPAPDALAIYNSILPEGKSHIQEKLGQAHCHKY